MDQPPDPQFIIGKDILVRIKYPSHFQCHVSFFVGLRYIL